MNAPTTGRRFDLDWIRIFAFAVLVPYHVGMYYVSWDWHVKSSFAAPTLEPFMILSAPWRLCLLFFISGVATAFLQAKSNNGFLRSRTYRLLLPLIFGMLVIVPPQSYFEVVKDLGYSNGYLAFWWQYLTGYQGFCDQDGCLDVPTWNHLWFLIYLLVYTLAIPLLKWLPSWPKKMALNGFGVLVWPALYFIIARLLLLERFESTHALFGDWYNHAQYFFIFILGVKVANSEAFWQAMHSKRWLSLALTLAGAIFLFSYFSYYSDAFPAPDYIRLIQRMVWGMQQWLVICTLLGFAYQWRHADSSAIRLLTQAVFPLYILHQTVIILLTQVLKPLAWHPILEGPALIALTFATCWLAFLVLRRLRWIAPLFGIKNQKVSL